MCVCLFVCFIGHVICSVEVCTYVCSVLLASCSNCFAKGRASNYVQRLGRLLEAFYLNVIFASHDLGYVNLWREKVNLVVNDVVLLDRHV